MAGWLGGTLRFMGGWLGGALRLMGGRAGRRAAFDGRPGWAARCD
jgi:hypothetical protein